jgi:DNA (cytosine-5)-methyltransferase 1
VDNTQNIISFCTGYGGIELGLRRAGVDVRTVCNVEIEAFVQANLVAKIEEGRMDNAPIYSDLKTFPARIFRGKIHGVIGGYPCQPFSSAGKRKGEKDSRHLWPYIREHVRAIRPVWCFFENVRGHTTMGLWRVLSDLEEDGYRTEWGLFSAEETGAPHQRIRCFILAHRECAGSQGWIYGGQDKKRESVDGYSRCGGTGAHGRRDSEQLAHTASREPRQSQARNGGQDIGGGSEDTRWPARPGEEQYEWEEPRVTEAQSELGGAVDGSACGVDATANRVDRLRLLGNGVVPQTAEIAWKTLWEKLSEQS